MSQEDIDKAWIADNWNELFGLWKPSNKATKVEDLNLIKDLITLLRYWVTNEKKIGYFGEGVNPLNINNELSSDGFSSSLEFLGEVTAQVEKHKKLWQTSGRDTRFQAFETGFLVRKQSVLKYFKFQIIADGTNWRTPAKVKRIDIQYHKETKNGEIKIEIKTKKEQRKK